ncbi:MAG: redox-sensing transcriptional repressor Rex [Spirochaetales bacterium]|nr:redox-sensing transcriptional repressor Rex [Spirochaetales bacterium]
MKSKLNKELVIRLLKYRRILTQLKSLGFEKVFSNNLGDAIGVAPALVRKDFSLLVLGGNKRGGYNIDYLSEQLNRILGKSREQKIIIVGMGKIGSAVAQYKGFHQGDFEVAAGFDISPESLLHKIEVPVLPMSQLKDFIQTQQIEVAILAVPEDVATDCHRQLKDAGIRGILNFTPIELKTTENCIIHNINIGVEIENLFFQVVKSSLPFDVEAALPDLSDEDALADAET